MTAPKPLPLAIASGFLSGMERRAIIDMARPRLGRSPVASRATGMHEVDERRSSSGCWISNADLPILDAIDARIEELFGLKPDHAEALQVLRYTVGQEYRPHFDYFPPADPGSGFHIARAGQRIATLLMYLEAPLAGGETTFPHAGLTVKPIPGLAVMFGYDRPNADTLSLHGGAPVTAGEKWVGTRWYHERRFAA